MKLFPFAVLVLLFGFNVLAWNEVLRNGKNEVVFFSVGQGDGALIKTREGHQIVIDGGPDNTILEKLGKEMAPWDKTIDLLILSHPAQDHATGAIKALENYEVKNVLWTGVVKDTEVFKAWASAVSKEKTNVVFAQSFQKILWNESKGCKIQGEVLSPQESVQGKSVKDDNETSLVVKFTFCDDSVLFTGDMGKTAERELIAKNADFDSTILKVSHHGSKGSTSEDFLKKVSPSLAVISVGENSYGHPSPEVLEILGQYGIEIKRTDSNGDIHIQLSK